MADPEPRIRDMFPRRRSRAGTLIVAIVALVIAAVGAATLVWVVPVLRGGERLGPSTPAAEERSPVDDFSLDGYMPRRAPFHSFGFGNTSIRLLGFEEVEDGTARARIRLTKDGLGNTELETSEFVVVDPGGRSRAPVSGPEEVTVGTEEPVEVALEYAVGPEMGRYHLAWIHRGREVGSWPVYCHRCT